MFLGLLIVIIAFLFSGIHKIEEGYVGVYYYTGILQKKLSYPGYNFMIPLLTKVNSVQVTVQTDQVTEIPCGTSGGVIIYFDKIEVVNQLSEQNVYDVVKQYSVDYDQIWIYDKIHHEINQFCSTHTLHEVFIEKFDSLDESLQEILQDHLKVWIPGVKILSIRVTKPRIPDKIKQNFELMENEKNKYLIEVEKQRTLIQQSQTSQRKQTIQAQSDLEITKINVEKKIQEIKSQIEISKIDNEIYLQNQKTQTDLEFQKNMTSIQNEQMKFSQNYLKYKAIDALTSNLELVLGPQIPNINVNQHK